MPKPPCTSNTLPHLAACESGIAALEFAFIAPVFILLLMGIIEFSMIMFTSTVMESATNTTARLGKTGYVPPGLSRAQAIIENIENRTLGLLDPNKITLSNQIYSNLDKIGQPEPCINPTSSPCPGTAGVNFQDINGNGQWDPDMGKAGEGGAGDIVVYTVSYPWKVNTPIVSSIIGSTITLTARTVVKNEPFNSGLQ